MAVGDAPAGSFGQFAAPAGSLVTGSLSNRGNPTAFGEDNTFRVLDQQQIRLVDNSGNVLFSGYGPDAANQAVALGQSISEAEGNKAGWTIETGERTINPDGSVGPTRWVAAANEKVNVSPIGAIADIALPVAGSLLAGPLGLGSLGLGAAGTAAAGAALGSGVSSVAQGRSLENALLRAAIAGGGSYLGSQLFAPGAGSMPGINADLIPNALSGLNFGSIASTAIPAGVGGAASNLASDLVVNAILNAAPSTTGSIVGSSIANAATNAVNTSQPSTTKNEFGSNVTPEGEIVLTGTQPTSLLPAVIGTGAAGGGVVLADALSNAAAANAQGATTSFADTAATRTSLTPGQLAAINAGAGAGGVFGTGLTAGQLATIGGLGASAIGSLFGGSGSGGTGTGTPYVSPFGAGPAIGGADFRVNPNIKNYEEYGFGGEATFFRPEYNKLVSSGASMGGAPIGGTATTNTPTYTPLIGGATTGDTTTTGGATTGGTTAITKQERPAGFTGVVSGQQVGDTQVVDGTTWSYGGDKAGWQMQYVNDAGQTALLPGNGATNVSSFANNPTVAVNQPYFAQNTANIPGWAETYQGFQRGLMSKGITGDAKAAAERELFSAIETQPFANPQALVDYARTVYNKYTTPGLI